MQKVSKKEKTMQNIIDATIKLFSSKGYSATTTSLIAKEAGVSEAIIFKHFKNKENLLKEISLIAISQIVENISIIPFIKNIEESKNYSLKDFIRSIIEERFSFFDKNFELVKLLIIEMQYSGELKTQIKKLVFPKISEVYNFFVQILKSKINIDDLKAEAIARIVIGVIASVAIQKYILDIDISNEQIEKKIEEILLIIEKGIV